MLFSLSIHYLNEQEIEALFPTNQIRLFEDKPTHLSENQTIDYSTTNFCIYSTSEDGCPFGYYNVTLNDFPVVIPPANIIQCQEIYLAESMTLDVKSIFSGISLNFYEKGEGSPFVLGNESVITLKFTKSDIRPVVTIGFYPDVVKFEGTISANVINMHYSFLKTASIDLAKISDQNPTLNINGLTALSTIVTTTINLQKLSHTSSSRLNFNVDNSQFDNKTYLPIEICSNYVQIANLKILLNPKSPTPGAYGFHIATAQNLKMSHNIPCDEIFISNFCGEKIFFDETFIDSPPKVYIQSTLPEITIVSYTDDAPFIWLDKGLALRLEVGPYPYGICVYVTEDSYCPSEYTAVSLEQFGSSECSPSFIQGADQILITESMTIDVNTVFNGISSPIISADSIPDLGGGPGYYFYDNAVITLQMPPEGHAIPSLIINIPEDNYVISGSMNFEKIGFPLSAINKHIGIINATQELIILGINPESQSSLDMINISVPSITCFLDEKVRENYVHVKINGESSFEVGSFKIFSSDENQTFSQFKVHSPSQAPMRLSQNRINETNVNVVVDFYRYGSIWFDESFPDDIINATFKITVFALTNELTVYTLLGAIPNYVSINSQELSIISSQPKINSSGKLETWKLAIIIASSVVVVAAAGTLFIVLYRRKKLNESITELGKALM